MKKKKSGKSYRGGGKAKREERGRKIGRSKE